MKVSDFDRVAWLGVRRARLHAAREAVDSFCLAFYWLTCPPCGGTNDLNYAAGDFLRAGIEADAAAEFDQAMRFLDWKRAETERRAVARNRRIIRRAFEVRP